MNLQKYKMCVPNNGSNNVSRNKNILEFQKSEFEGIHYSMKGWGRAYSANHSVYVQIMHHR